LASVAPPRALFHRGHVDREAARRRVFLQRQPIAERIGEKRFAVDFETGAVLEDGVDVVEIELDLDGEIAACGAHRVAAASRAGVDLGKLSGQRRIDHDAFALDHPAPLAVANIGRGSAFAAVQADYCRAHALIFQAERAARIPLRAQRFEAGQKSLEALLLGFEQALELTLAAARDIGDRANGLIDHDVVGGSVREDRHDRRQANVHHYQGCRQGSAKGQTEHS
jgi:hypothetical protein